MAERLPRYRPLGVRIPGVPSVNYAQTGQAQARVYDTLASALTQMSEFAFERQKAKTIREAERFAFDNPVTDEQLEIALTEGIKPEDINVDPDTVFGATVLATTGKMMRAELEGRYRTNVALLQKAVESPDWNPMDEQSGVAAINTALAGLENGFYDALAGVDAGEALALKAAIAPLGSAVYKSALEKQNKLAVLERRTSAQTTLDAFPAAVRATVAEFAGGDVEQLNKSLQVQINSMRSTLNATGDIEFAETEGATLFDEVSQAKVNVLSAFALEDGFAASDTERAAKIRRGEFGRYTKIYNAMSPEEQAKVRQSIREEQSARATEDSRKREEEDRAYATSVAIIGQRLADPDILSSQADMQIDNLYEIAQATNGRVISITTIRGLEKEMREGVVSNPVGNLEFRMAIARGEVVQDNFEEKRIEYGVTAKDAVSMVGTMETANRQIEADVLRYARRSARVFSENAPYTDEQATQMEMFLKKVDEEYAAAVSDWVDGGRQGAKPSKKQIAKAFNLEFAAQGFTQAIDEIIKSQNISLEQYGIIGFFSVSTTEQDIDELVFPNEDDQKKIDSVKRNLKSALMNMQDQLDKQREFLND
jgi:hypothetical protein